MTVSRITIACDKNVVTDKTTDLLTLESEIESTPTVTPEPTKEPAPSPTPIPTPTSIPEPETLYDFIPTEPYFSYSGSGDDVITEVMTDSYSSLKFVCKDNRHKAIKAHYNDTYDLLVNSTEPYSGYTLLFPETEYIIEINADGPWDIEIYNIGSASNDKFSGIGDWVSPIFISSSDVYEIIAEGGGHFAVKGYYGYGDYDLLVNTTDSYTGKVMFKQKGEYCFFEIMGERNWSIQPK